MPGAAKEQTRRKKLHVDDESRNLQNKKQNLKQKNRNHSSLSKKKVTNRLSNGSAGLKKKVVNKAIAHKIKTCKNRSFLRGLKDKPLTISTKDNGKKNDRDVQLKNLKRRKKKRKDNVELDEASRWQRRTKYLLIKLKLEQNLIDAYSAEGWKGQSREKIKPEKELQRAKKQILKCKLGIREAIHQLDLLSSVGRIDDSAVAPDGSVHHEHIICAKCKMREAFPDNDIILCDGTCNRAFHQKCLDPPLSTENIPPGDEGWFCKFCRSKMEILEATNAHLGTHFAMDSDWQDIFREEAILPDGEDTLLCPGQEWPSDDSEDDDYDPERIEHSSSDSLAHSESDGSEYSSSFLGSLEDEPLLLSESNEESRKEGQDLYLELIGLDSDEINDGEALCGRRQRSTVDYLKLHDEMFGKNAAEDEQISEDEDWGPKKRRRKGKETETGGTLMTLFETENCSDKDPKEVRENLRSGKIKRPIFRLPTTAVEKLRFVFAENELPPRAVRENLSKQLGIEFDKVNKWFKNARYLALKARKAENAKSYHDVSHHNEEEFTSEAGTSKHDDQKASKNSTSLQTPKSSKKGHRGKKTGSLTTNTVMGTQWRKNVQQKPATKKMAVDFGDDVSLKLLREKSKEAKKKSKQMRDMLAAENEMKRLCEIKSKLENLQQVLRGLQNQRLDKLDASTSSEPPVIYVPVAEVTER